MTIESDLLSRSQSRCELCSATEGLSAYQVLPDSDGSVDHSILLCSTCISQIEDASQLDVNHWRCLNDSMWSQVPVIQVMAWRMLNRLSGEGWPQELLDMLYLDDETLAWAQAEQLQDAPDQEAHFDSNGVSLNSGDTVVLTKDLNVKGAGFTAKRGTAVRGISLVADNSDHIEGRVNGQRIVILTKFVKKTN
jgi:protein PhnA